MNHQIVDAVSHHNAHTLPSRIAKVSSELLLDYCVFESGGIVSLINPNDFADLDFDFVK